MDACSCVLKNTVGERSDETIMCFVDFKKKKYSNRKKRKEKEEVQLCKKFSTPLIFSSVFLLTLRFFDCAFFGTFIDFYQRNVTVSQFRILVL